MYSQSSAGESFAADALSQFTYTVLIEILNML